jgi:hypothetical protein
MAYCQWKEAISFIQLTVPPAFIDRVATQTDNNSRATYELINTWHTHDAKILQISQWLLDEQHSGGGRLDTLRDSQNPAFQKITERNWQIIAELETVAKELDRSMAQVALNWTANQPGIGSVIIGATKQAQLEDNLKALDFQISGELSDRLQTVSRPKSQFPYSYFESEIQGMIHGGKPVGLKPTGYYPNIFIESAGAGVS